MEKEYGSEKGKSVFYASRNAGKITGVDAADMAKPEWQELEKLFVKWIEEEGKEQEHTASDADPLYFTVPEKSQRHFDDNGFMHVKDCPISKACVNPYRGDEIPNWERLGLDPSRVYNLLRDPEELKKAASSFDNMPLLSQHKTQTSSSPDPHLRVGSLGTGTYFDDPYLRTPSLAIYDDPAISGIENEVQRELSSSYRYDADMVPGEFRGAKYDGVMRNIRGNHVALVEAGRAGSDVAVSDQGDFIMPVASRPSGRALMALGAIHGFVAPRLAADARMDLTGVRSILQQTTNKNWLQQKPRLATRLAADLRGKCRGTNGLAQDADLEAIHALLDSLDGEKSMAGDDDPGMGFGSGSGGKMPSTGMDEEETEEEKKERMERRAEDRRNGRDCAADEEEETEEEKEHRKEARDRRAKDRRMGKDAEPKEREEAEKEHKAEDRKAWDARMKARDARRGAHDGRFISRAEAERMARDSAAAAEQRVMTRITALSEARSAVMPLVGAINSDAVGMDSAEGIYRYALEYAGVDLAGVPPSAYRAMVQREIHHAQNQVRTANDSFLGGAGGGVYPSDSGAFDAWMGPEAGRVKSY